ncbi:GNAT family N-acetyltransferase (plasmid) [Cytobacillus spongiae]|uniref:GNAT family N-acetyltransferase n=1 Tax=Cytobacillus spongiae TaxID=2901381 RepID=UPI001F1F75F9|nr:GNAT family N-acetyltransferase [Cytobacillus spongiae]UII58282.1 GNAT family N-acetyltransferase [Cytobacillus spongiae]
MNIQPLYKIHKDRLKDFFQSQWGSSVMVISSGVYDCTKLEGFAVVRGDHTINGLITYEIKNDECEIISLDSLEEGQGIGTVLMEKVISVSKHKKCNQVKLITTNDNLDALRFFQKRGFVLKKLLVNAVEKARLVKPEIPLIGNDGIPIRDEIVLIRKLHM